MTWPPSRTDYGVMRHLSSDCRSSGNHSTSCPSWMTTSSRSLRLRHYCAPISRTPRLSYPDCPPPYHRSSCELRLDFPLPVTTMSQRSSRIDTSSVLCPSSSFWIPTTIGSNVDRSQKCVRNRIFHFEQWTGTVLIRLYPVLSYSSFVSVAMYLQRTFAASFKHGRSPNVGSGWW